MAFLSVAVVIRCQNEATYGVGAFRLLTIRCLTEDPELVPEDTDDIEYVGGERVNAVAERWKYTLVGWWYTAASGDLDNGDYVYICRSLRANHLWLDSITYMGGAHPRVGESGSIYASGQALQLPRKVRRTGVSLEKGDTPRKFRVTVALEDVLPVVGEVI